MLIFWYQSLLLPFLVPKIGSSDMDLFFFLEDAQFAMDAPASTNVKQ